MTRRQEIHAFALALDGLRGSGLSRAEQALAHDTIVARIRELEQAPDPDPTPTPTPSPSVPLSAPGEALEGLENDKAALTMALRLAEHGAGAVARMAGRAYRLGGDRLLASLYQDGAGGFEASALVAWLREKIAETRNTIDALTGAGPPLPELEPPRPIRVVLGLDGGIVQGASSTAPVEITVRDYDTEGAAAADIIRSPSGDYVPGFPGSVVDPALVELTERETMRYGGEPEPAGGAK